MRACLPAWMLLTFLLAGCGQKGELYLPEPSEATGTFQTESIDRPDPNAAT